MMTFHSHSVVLLTLTSMHTWQETCIDWVVLCKKW